MKYLLLPLTLLLFSNSYAFPGLSITSPDDTKTAAKYAKQKAKIQVFEELQIKPEDVKNNSDGCDLNIGNLSIEKGVTQVPNDLIVIVEGDVIQANNCQTN